MGDELLTRPRGRRYSSTLTLRLILYLPEVRPFPLGMKTMKPLAYRAGPISQPLSTRVSSFGYAVVDVVAYKA